MNIVEAYIKFNKQLIILVSGLSGSGKTQLATEIERDFKIKKINIENYCNDSHDIRVELQPNVTIMDWDHIDSYNWDKINDDVEKNKSNGIVVCGPYFITDKIKFNPDFHISIKISKQQLIQRRKEFIKQNPELCKELIQHIDTPIETMIVNRITYPHYLEYIEKSKVTKYINAFDLNNDQICDQVADYLFAEIKIPKLPS